MNDMVYQFSTNSRYEPGEVQVNIARQENREQMMYMREAANDSSVVPNTVPEGLHPDLSQFAFRECRQAFEEPSSSAVKDDETVSLSQIWEAALVHTEKRLGSEPDEEDISTQVATQVNYTEVEEDFNIEEGEFDKHFEEVIGSNTEDDVVQSSQYSQSSVLDYSVPYRFGNPRTGSPRRSLR
jgi:hypothetical protein